MYEFFTRRSVPARQAHGHLDRYGQPQRPEMQFIRVASSLLMEGPPMTDVARHNCIVRPECENLCEDNDNGVLS